MDKILLDRYERPLKIALIGGARTGKDTIANYLCSISDFQRVAFGDALKKYLHEIFKDLPTNPKPREEMIKFGQSLREIDENIWIKHLDEEVYKWACFGYPNIVITDVRQLNEIDYCKRNGYTFVKVVADKSTQVDRALAGGEILDPSNILDSNALEFEDYDYLIENNGSLLDLYEQVEEVLQKG